MTKNKFIRHNANGLINSLFKILHIAIGTVSIPILIGVLGLENYGIYVVLMSVGILLSVVNAGLSNSLLQANDKLYWLFYLILNAMFSIFIIITIIFIIMFPNKLISLVGFTAIELQVEGLYGAVLMTFAQIYLSVLSTYYIKIEDFISLNVIKIFVNLVGILFIILFFIIFLNLSLAIFYSGTMVLSIVILISARLVYKNRRMIIFSLLSMKSLYAFFSTTQSFFTLSGITVLVRPFFLILLNHGYGSVTVALFDIALKVLDYSRLIIVSVIETSYPRFLRYIKNNKNNAIVIYNKYLLKILIIISIVYFTIHSFVTSSVLTYLFGNKYEMSYQLIEILSIGYAFNMATASIYYYFMSMDGYKRYLIINQSILACILPIIYFKPESVNTIVYFYNMLLIASSVLLFFVYAKTVKYKKIKL